jgi:hypothetical protein
MLRPALGVEPAESGLSPSAFQPNSGVVVLPTSRRPEPLDERGVPVGHQVPGAGV